MIKKVIKQISFTAGEYKNIECQIPGTVCTALAERGLISGNASAVAEISKEGNLFSESTFTAKIDFSASEASKRFIYLRISGILSKSEIIFNGRSYGMVGNAGREAIFDIADKVTVGENILTVESSDTAGRRRHLENSGEVSEAYDTAPYIYDAGIIGAIELILSDTPIISSVRTTQIHEDDGRVNIIVEVDMLGEAENIRAVASLTSPSGKIYFGGAFEGKIRISVPDPELWWPRGYGAQGLYKLGVTVYHGGEAKDTYEKKIGLRRVNLSADENGVPRIYVNDVRIFSLGGTYIAKNAFLSSFDKKETEKLIKAAADANMNTIAVFDEGILPCESFFELCDKYGMLVWQSLSVPYAAPPAAGVFAAGLYDAINDIAERISSHPSVALVFLSIVETAKETIRLFPDAIEEFRSVCLKIIKPVIEKITNSIFIDNIDKLSKYDERYIGNQAVPEVLYSLPDERTLEEFLPEDEYNLFSKTAEMHTSKREHALGMMATTSGEMKFPSGMSELVYATELAAAITLSRSVMKARCENKLCASAVLRQYNDGYYAISAASVDYALRKKALCYKIREANAQVFACGIPCGENMRFYAKNDSKKLYTGKLMYALYDTKGKCWFETNADVSLAPSETHLVAEENFSKYLSGNPENYYVIYELFTEKGVTSKGTERFVPIKHFAFLDPKIKADVTGMGTKFSIKLTASTYVTGAYVSFGDVEIYPETNFVDVIPTEPTVIEFETDSAISPQELTSRLLIKTPFDYGK